eukprot:3450388-Pyramimonas_sp.AAC.1
MPAQSPSSFASLDSTVGGSWLWSPTRTTVPPLLIRFSMDMSAWSSVACPASSMARRTIWGLSF